ncbi:MAG: hypothetical protein AAB845_00780 [Patescibacteria group bacterium]
MVSNVLSYNEFASIYLVIFGGLGLMTGLFSTNGKSWVGPLLGTLVGMSIFLSLVVTNRPPVGARPMTDEQIVQAEQGLVLYERRYRCDEWTQIGFFRENKTGYVLLLMDGRDPILGDQARTEAEACYRQNRQIF